MSQYVNCRLTWQDNSSGAQDETGQEIDIYTDSPSFVPNVPINYTEASHPWMRLKPIAPGQVQADIQLAIPCTFVTYRVRQVNAAGYGPWSSPPGVKFLIAQPSGATVPPAPSNMGFAVIGSGPVSPPPPPPPPVTPPPPPPVTGGGGSSANYSSVSQFSGVQGQNQWSYLDGLNNPLVYDSANQIWRGDELYLAIWSTGFHHGSNGSHKDVKKRWTAPANGQVNISGTFFLYEAGSGATVTIKHNAATIFGPQAMTYGNQYPYSITGRPVLTGDTIDFILNEDVALVNNNTNLDPVIQLTTDGVTPANPTVSSLSPGSFAVGVGGTVPMTVTLTSPAIAAAVVSLSSSDPTKITAPATVTIPLGQSSATFVATGVAVGSSTIQATYNSTNKTSSGTVAAAPSGTFTNAIVGGVVLADHAFNTVLFPGAFEDYPGTNVIDSDATAPSSPPNCLKQRMEALAPTGVGGWHYIAPTTYREMYVGMYWRANSLFQGNLVGSNKLFFIRGPGTNGVWGLVNPPNSPSFTFMFGHNTGFGLDNSHIMSSDLGLVAYPNVSSAVVFPGVWYKVEAWIRASTTRTSRDGAIKWWLNGVLVGSYEQFNYCGLNGETLNEVVIDHTWDGSPVSGYGSVNTKPWEHWFDGILIMGKN